MRAILLITIFMLCCAGAFAETWVSTAYCPCEICTNKTPSDVDYAVTASGRMAQEGMVAINWLAFGTVVTIDGVDYIVEDRGARSIFGSKDNRMKRVDIYFSTHKQAVEFGRKTVDLKIKGE